MKSILTTLVLVLLSSSVFAQAVIDYETNSAVYITCRNPDRSADRSPTLVVVSTFKSNSLLVKIFGYDNSWIGQLEAQPILGNMNLTKPIKGDNYSVFLNLSKARQPAYFGFLNIWVDSVALKINGVNKSLYCSYGSYHNMYGRL